MELKSIRCPNCGGPVRQINENRFVCDSCGTSFMPDYDREDVDMQRIKAEEEIQKRRLEMQRGTGNPSHPQVRRSSSRARGIAIAIIVIVCFSSIISLSVFVNIVNRLRISGYGTSSSYQESREAERRASSEARERERQESREAEERAKEASKQALLASYKVTPEDLLEDEFFVENAVSALRNKLESNTFLVWDNWVWNEEPEYLTSYLLLAKDDNNRTHNILINIYKVHWDREHDDGTVDHYVMYDGTCLKNVSINEDGTIKTDYGAGEMTYNSEIIGSQMINGYSDYDDLIRQEIYGNADYTYVEFQFPESVETSESAE